MKAKVVTSANNPRDLLWLVVAIPFALMLLFMVQGSVEVRSVPDAAAEVLIDGKVTPASAPGVHRSGPMLIGPHSITMRTKGTPELQTSAFVWLSQRVVLNVGGAHLDVTGRWRRVDSDGANTLWVLEQVGNTLTGRIEASGQRRLREVLEGSITPDARLSVTSTVHEPNGGSYFNGGFYGDLSKDGDRITGTYEVTAHVHGEWTLERLVATPVSPTQPLSASAERRFERTDCGAIRDTHTGHMWLVGPDQTMSLVDATAWASDQTACTGGWRLPTENELSALFDPAKSAGLGFESSGRRWPAHIDPIFERIGSGAWAWTASPTLAGRATTWNLNQDCAAQMSASAPEYPVRVFAIK